MVIEHIQAAIKEALAVLYEIDDMEPGVTITEPQFGDFASNVSLQLAARLEQSPRDIADSITRKLRQSKLFASAEVAGPGFINLTLTDENLRKHAPIETVRTLAGKTVVAEYSDPNPFKVLHAGHLYTSLVGDAIANLLERAGATVHRVNFGGDVGLHVGKTMWAIIQKLGGEFPDELQKVDPAKRLEWLSEQYVKGHVAYGNDTRAKEGIIELNKQVYQLHEEDERSTPFARIYWICREWSYTGFDELYKQLKMAPFEKYYPESETAPAGSKIVNQGLKKGVFEKSDGAIVYRGEQDNLHTRVFINSNGLPTYEAKDLGLAATKWLDYRFDENIIITGNDINEYMKVVLAALRHFYPEAASRTQHLTHGMIRLAGGLKMSSREGNILRAVDVLETAQSANKEQSNKDQPEVVLAAVKYAFLKQRMGGDIIYDPAESVSLVGNSGPYLQYAHARACSVLAKVSANAPGGQGDELTPSERLLLRKLAHYNLVVAQAIEELLPHMLCTYLYELSQVFNRFYEANRVVGDNREAIRLELVRLYVAVLKDGLGLLGISAPERI